MRSLAAHIEAVADVRAERLVAARLASRALRAVYEAAKRADAIQTTPATRAALAESEFQFLRAERTKRALSQTTRDASCSH